MDGWPSWCYSWGWRGEDATIWQGEKWLRRNHLAGLPGKPFGNGFPLRKCWFKLKEKQKFWGTLACIMVAALGLALLPDGPQLLITILGQIMRMAGWHVLLALWSISVPITQVWCEKALFLPQNPAPSSHSRPLGELPRVLLVALGIFRSTHFLPTAMLRVWKSCFKKRKEKNVSKIRWNFLCVLG